MFWRKKHPRPRHQNAHYARLIFQSLLARHPDPRSLDHCSSELDNGLDLRCLVDRITQSGEYLDSHDPNPASPDGGRPRVWTDAAYAAYREGAEIKSILLMKIDHLGDFILALELLFGVSDGIPEGVDNAALRALECAACKFIGNFRCGGDDRLLRLKTR